MSADGEGPDLLRSTLIAARQQSDRGIQECRRVWEFCAMAFREWHGVQFVSDVPTVPERRLTHDEMVRWFRLAEDLPGIARDVLKMQSKAARGGHRIRLREMRWSTERRAMLVELHQHALQWVATEMRRARADMEEVSKMRHATRAKRAQAMGRLMRLDDWERQLSSQLQALAADEKCE
jgi:hypothetical protein